jgi:hypothetical protein
MEDETEPNVYDQYEMYVKQVEVKQSNDISAEVDDEKNVDVYRLVFIRLLHGADLLSCLVANL